MNNPDRLQKLASYGEAYEQIKMVLDDIPPQARTFKPSPEEWSIHEVIVHLADMEANAYVRLLKALAEPGGAIMPLDQEKWADRLFYHEQDLHTALELFRWLRIKTHALLLVVPAGSWNNTMNHPESGLLDIDKWLDNYEKHARVHIEQIKRVYRQWQLQPAAAR
jgi:hypothetical protein